MGLFWKLSEDGSVEPCSDSRHVGLLVVRSAAGDGRVLISTIFLGVDHSFGSGDPIFFETAVMIRGKHSFLEAFRRIAPSTVRTEVLAQYRTLSEAASGHARYCQELFGTTPHQTSYGPIPALARRVSSDISSAPFNKERA